MNFTLTLNPTQQQRITQRQIQSLHILMMNNFELHEFLEQEYLENPFLEYNIPHYSLPFNSGETYTDYKDISNKEMPLSNINFLLNLFLEQLNPSDFTNTEWNTLKLMILLLDDNGFFHYSPNELQTLYKIPINRSKKLLCCLQALEPCGIFQPNLENSLLYQLNVRKQCTPEMTCLIRRHLPDIAAGKLTTIARSLNLDISYIKSMIEQLKQLSPYPLSNFRQDACINIRPDILVNCQNNIWDIQLNDNWIGNYPELFTEQQQQPLKSA